jgi:hypothetical protein
MFQLIHYFIVYSLNIVYDWFPSVYTAMTAIISLEIITVFTSLVINALMGDDDDDNEDDDDLEMTVDISYNIDINYNTPHKHKPRPQLTPVQHSDQHARITE